MDKKYYFVLVTLKANVLTRTEKFKQQFKHGCHHFLIELTVQVNIVAVVTIYIA